MSASRSATTVTRAAPRSSPARRVAASQRTLWRSSKARLQAARLATFGALQELRVERAEDGAARRIDGDHRVQITAPAAARRPRHRRVLHRQDIPPRAGGLGAPEGRGDHLPERHGRVAQEPGDADLARPIPAEAPHPHAACPMRHQPRQQIGPPFSRRRSPNLPNAKSIPLSLFAEGITRIPQAQTRCVNVVGPRQARKRTCQAGARGLQTDGDARPPLGLRARALRPTNRRDAMRRFCRFGASTDDRMKQDPR